MPRTRTLIATGGVLVEILATAYLILIAYLIGVWMMNDSVAFRMTPADWYLEALTRFGQSSIVAALLGIPSHYFNRWAFRSRPTIGMVLTWVAFGSVSISGLLGAVEFAVTKPYM